MPRKKKKLKINDIKSNSSREIGGVINNIKQHERKYTIILVILFMLVFFVTAYFSFRVNEEIVTLYETYTPYTNEITVKNNDIIFTKKDIMTETEGINKKQQEISFKNNTEDSINYKILFQLEDDISNIMSFDDIKYTLDGINVFSLSQNNELIKIGIIDSNTTEKFKIKMWISPENKIEEDFIINGKFILEKMEDIN